MLLPLVGSVAPLIALPVIARVADQQSWAAIAIGQSVGMFAAIVGGYGWSVAGSVEVAHADEASVMDLVAEATLSRGVVTLVAGALGVAVTVLISSNDTLLAAGMTTSSALTGACAVSWFAIGRGLPAISLLYETMPRLAGNLAGALASYVTGVLLLYPIAIMIAIALSHAAFLSKFSARLLDRTSWQRTWSRLRSNRSAFFIEVSAGSYLALGPAVVGIFAAADEVAQFSSIDRLTKLAAFSIAALNGSLQGWLASSFGHPLHERQLRISIALHGVLACGGGALIAFGGTGITSLLFGRELATTPTLSAIFGLLFIIWAADALVGRHMLIIRGKRGVMAKAMAVGAFMGVPLLFVLSAHRGPNGAALALLATYVCIVTVQILGLARASVPDIAAPDRVKGT